jgi:hypothetical protein
MAVTLHAFWYLLPEEKRVDDRSPNAAPGFATRIHSPRPTGQCFVGPGTTRQRRNKDVQQLVDSDEQLRKPMQRIQLHESPHLTRPLNKGGGQVLCRGLLGT